MYTKRCSGFTVIEFALAIIVGLLIVASAVMVGAHRSEDLHAYEAATAILDIRDTAAQAYASNTAYTDSAGTAVTLPLLFGLNNRLPRAVINNAAPGSTPTAAQLGNIWGGTYAVGVASSTNTATPACAVAPVGPAMDILSITITKVPAQACVDMVGQVAPRMYDTTVNGSLVALTPPPASGLPGRGFVKMSQAAPLCNGSANTIVFRALKPLNFSTLRSNPMTSNPTSAELACLNPQYNRVMNAMAARETAQAAL